MNDEVNVGETKYKCANPHCNNWFVRVPGYSCHYCPVCAPKVGLDNQEQREAQWDFERRHGKNRPDERE